MVPTSRSSSTIKCPITDLRFVSEYEALNYYAVKDYTVEQVYDDTYMVYSKKHGDNLPLLSPILEVNPCLNRHENTGSSTYLPFGLDE